MAKLIVGPKAHDYRWPSGCVTAFASGWSGTVKAEILADAVAKGWGEDGAAVENTDLSKIPDLTALLNGKPDRVEFTGNSVLEVIK